MTDRTQFEAMLEALINEDQETAKEIFHNIVVQKSREIYEELLAEDFTLAEGKDGYEEEEEEEEPYEPKDDSDSDNADDADDSKEDDDEEGDATDDFIDDTEDGEEAPFGDEEDGEEGELEDRVMDLEDALDELKAEFEQLMASEEGEEEHGDEFGGDELGGNEFGGDDMGGADELDNMMEYVNKVSLPKHGDNGANAQSIVAKANKMGGTSGNIAQSFSTEKGGTQGGLLKPTTSIQDAGNVNKPGANVGKTAFKKKEPGHGAEKKGSGDTAPNKKSLIGSRK